MIATDFGFQSRFPFFLQLCLFCNLKFFRFRIFNNVHLRIYREFILLKSNPMFNISFKLIYNTDEILFK